MGEIADHPTDTSVGVIRVDDLEGNAIATLFRYSCHPVVVGGRSTVLSADFPGPARAIIGKTIGGVVLFMQGCGGNLNPKVGIGYEDDCSETNFHVGSALGAEALRVALGIRTNKHQKERVELSNIPNILFKPWTERTDHPEVVLSASHERVEFTFSPMPTFQYAKDLCDKWAREIIEREAKPALAWEIRVAKKYLLWAQAMLEAAQIPNPSCGFEAHAFRIGEISILGMNTETFYETGFEIQLKSPFEHTFVLGYTNGTIMYLPREEDYPEGGWKIDQPYALPDLMPQGYCQPSMLSPDSEKKAVEASLRVLNQLI